MGKTWFFVNFGAVQVFKLISLLTSKVMFALLNICLLIALVLLTVLSILHCSDRYPLHFGQPPCLSLCLRQILLRSSDHFFKSCIAFTEAWFLFFLPATLLLYSLIFHCPSLMSLLISWVARWEVVFKDMLRMRSSTFRVFRACEEASGGEGFAEDFSLTRDISAAELTHIDHKRKRMPRYFKPLQGT